MKVHIMPASLTLAALLFAPFAVDATPGGPERGHRVTGTLACGGNHFVRADNEQHATSFTLRNFASEGTITIESVKIYDALGDLIYDSESSGFPAAQTLGSHQSTLFSSSILGGFLPADRRPIQAIFEWSASGRSPDLELSGSTTRLARQGEERSRSQGECKPLGRQGPWGLLGR
jgi:hypothetical protein